MISEIKLIDKLCQGYSTQSKTANQFWIVLIITSIITLTGNPDHMGLVNLPFALGRVKPALFYMISVSLISVITIAYTASMTQALRARRLIQIVIDDIENKYVNKVHIQDVVDSILIPTYNRVAPISQFILGKNQFLGQGKVNHQLRITSTALYITLKLFSYMFLYAMPVISLIYSFNNFCISEKTNGFQIATPFLTFMIALAITSILILWIGDLKYLIKVINRIKT